MPGTWRVERINGVTEHFGFSRGTLTEYRPEPHVFRPPRAYCLFSRQINLNARILFIKLPPEFCRVVRKRKRERESLRPFVHKVASRLINFYFRARNSIAFMTLLQFRKQPFSTFITSALPARYFDIFSRYFGYRAVFVTPSVLAISQGAGCPEIMPRFSSLDLVGGTTTPRVAIKTACDSVIAEKSRTKRLITNRRYRAAERDFRSGIKFQSTRRMCSFYRKTANTRDNAGRLQTDKLVRPWNSSCQTTPVGQVISSNTALATAKLRRVITHQRFPISADYRIRWVQSVPKSCRTSRTSRKRSSGCLREGWSTWRDCCHICVTRARIVSTWISTHLLWVSKLVKPWAIWNRVDNVVSNADTSAHPRARVLRETSGWFKPLFGYRFLSWLNKFILLRQRYVGFGQLTDVLVQSSVFLSVSGNTNEGGISIQVDRIMLKLTRCLVNSQTRNFVSLARILIFTRTNKSPGWPDTLLSRRDKLVRPTKKFISTEFLWPHANKVGSSIFLSQCTRIPTVTTSFLISRAKYAGYFFAETRVRRWEVAVKSIDQISKLLYTADISSP